MELDQPTLSRCRRGDRAAFALLMRCYEARVHAVCVALAGTDGEDLTQDTFMRVFSQLHDFDPSGPAPLGAWILRIARNLCIDRSRSARLRLVGAAAGEPASAAASADDALIRAERAERVRLAVLALPHDQRAAVVLREWGELDYDAIAEIEGVPVGTIRSRLARAKETLRVALATSSSEVRHAHA